MRVFPSLLLFACKSSITTTGATVAAAATTTSNSSACCTSGTIHGDSYVLFVLSMRYTLFLLLILTLKVVPKLADGSHFTLTSVSFTVSHLVLFFTFFSN